MATQSRGCGAVVAVGGEGEEAVADGNKELAERPAASCANPQPRCRPGPTCQPEPQLESLDSLAWLGLGPNQVGRPGGSSRIRDRAFTASVLTSLQRVLKSSRIRACGLAGLLSPERARK